jgi:hypothetical protein
MEANEELGLEEICFVSHVPVKSEIHEGCFKKEMRNLKFEGMPYYINYSMARVKDSQYLMARSSGCYFVDIDTLKAKKAAIDNNICDLVNLFIDGEHMLMVRGNDKMTILRDLQNIGQIEFRAKLGIYRNVHGSYGRYVQQVGKTIYAVDEESDLYRIEWQDIRNCIDHKKLIKSEVENFFVDKILGMAIVDCGRILYLDNVVEVDLTKVNREAKWTIVTSTATCWIVSGDNDDKAVMASISKKGEVRSIFKLKMTSNGYIKYDGSEFGGVYALHKVYAKGMRGIMLAIERGGSCHLISIDYGRLSVLQSIDSIVPLDVVDDIEDELYVASVTSTGKRGEFIVGGENWTKLITVKYK